MLGRALNMSSFRRHILSKQSHGRLPSEYQEVEYLESTGTQRLKLFPNPINGCDLKIRVKSTENNNICYLCGTSRSGSEQDHYLILDAKTQNYTLSYIQGGITYFQTQWKQTNTDFHEWHTIEKRGTSLYIDDMLVLTNSRLNWGWTYALLFAISNQASGTYAYGKMQVSSATYVINGTEHNYIPCYRKSDSKPGMYDIINDVFYTNAGTGEFSVGGNV